MSKKPFCCRECEFSSEPFIQTDDIEIVECRQNPPDGVTGFPVVRSDAWCDAFIPSFELFKIYRDFYLINHQDRQGGR